MKLKKRKGFTLIELIIVVAILGILAAIAIPSFGRAQENSRRRADQATAKVVADTVVNLIADGAITFRGGDVTIVGGDTATAAEAEAADEATAGGAAEVITARFAEGVPHLQTSAHAVDGFTINIDANGNVTTVRESGGAVAATQMYPTPTAASRYALQ